MGKTHVMKEMISDLLEEFSTDEARLRLAIATPTGVAARVASTKTIVASTIHALFGIRNTNRARGSKMYVMESNNDEYLGRQVTPECEEYEHENELESVCLDDCESGTPTAHLNDRIFNRLEQLQVLVIDEISMVSTETVDLMDQCLQHVKRNASPFGGLLVLVVGDFFQLKPVLKKEDIKRYDGIEWAFLAAAWKVFLPFELVEVVRQDDRRFVDFLNRVRVGKHTEADVQWLKRNCRKGAGSNANADLALFPSNRRCTPRNEGMIGRLAGREFMFAEERHWYVEGEFDEPDSCTYDRHDRNVKYPDSGSFQTDLFLKIGCRVCCIRNIYGRDGQLCIANGQFGTVKDVDTESVQVTVIWDALSDKRKPLEWRVKSIGRKKRQTFKDGDKEIIIIAETWQLPLKVAYATTIHKSQGLSISKPVDVDPVAWTPDPNKPKKWFRGRTPAMVYVALSRSTRVSDIRLIGKTPLSVEDIVADEDVLRYYSLTFDDEIFKSNLK